MQSNAWIIFDCQTANQRRQHSHWNSTSPGHCLPPDTKQGPQGTHLFAGLENQLGNILLGSLSPNNWHSLGPSPSILSASKWGKGSFLRGWLSLWGLNNGSWMWMEAGRSRSGWWGRLLDLPLSRATEVARACPPLRPSERPSVILSFPHAPSQCHGCAYSSPLSSCWDLCQARVINNDESGRHPVHNLSQQKKGKAKLRRNWKARSDPLTK